MQKTSFVRIGLIFIITLFVLVSCGSKKTSKSNYTPKNQSVNHSSKGSVKSVNTGIYKRNVIAVYYHDKFNGRKTASGAIFDNNKQTAAHKELPFGTQVKVTNKANGKWVYVIINDRGPFGKGREIDLSKKAFMSITDDDKKGLLNVDIEIVKN